MNTKIADFIGELGDRKNETITFEYLSKRHGVGRP
jgi:hypothetical protein